MENTILNENVNKIENGETQLKRVFCKIVDTIGIYYKIGLNTDFTGMLYNEMYNWLPFPKNTVNDVVLTPPYVAQLLVRLARTDKDSYVFDNATGSAGLTRTNRKKAKINLKDTGFAKERYDELVNLVKFGKKELKYLKESDYYEGEIDPESGKDWNQSAPIDRRPNLKDFKKTVGDFLAFEVMNILKREEDEGKK